MSRNILHFAAFLSAALLATPAAAESTWDRTARNVTEWGRAIDLNNRAHILTSQGRYDEAIAAAKEAIGILPQYGTAYNNLGFAYLQKGEFDEAALPKQVRYQATLHSGSLLMLVK